MARNSAALTRWLVGWWRRLPAARQGRWLRAGTMSRHEPGGGLVAALVAGGRSWLVAASGPGLQRSLSGQPSAFATSPGNSRLLANVARPSSVPLREVGRIDSGEADVVHHHLADLCTVEQETDRPDPRRVEAA